MTKRALLTILTLLIAACLVLSVIVLPGAFFAIQQALLPPPGATPLPTAATVPTRTAVPTFTATPIPSLAPTEAPTATVEQTAAPIDESDSNVPPDVFQQMEIIEQQVVQLRGLSFKQGLKHNVLTKDQLREKVTNDFFKNYTKADAANDSRILSAFGLLPAGFDLMNFYLDLYTEQVAGFYDSETKEMYVVQGEKFGGPERLTYAHEFTHALQDQTYDLRDGLNLRDEYCKDHSQYCNATSSLIEGDATTTSYSWFFEFGTAQDRSEMQDFSTSNASPVYDSAPEYMKQDFIFPYQQGMEFFQSLLDRGFDSIAQAYTDPPDSSEQILHPDRYPSDQPVDLTQIDLSASLGDGWTQINQDVLGEWYTYLVLAEGYQREFRLPQDQARTAAAGWQGDRYSAYWNEAEQQFALEQRWLWDRPQDTQEFWDALQAYGQARWGNPERRSDSLVWEKTTDGTVTIRRNSGEVIWLIAPDAEKATKMYEQMTTTLEQ